MKERVEFDVKALIKRYPMALQIQFSTNGTVKPIFQSSHRNLLPPASKKETNL
jgi:hypothetical protein